MTSPGVLPRARIDDLVITELESETLVYDLKRDKAHCLNGTSALVWRRCDGKTTVEEMVELLQEQLPVSVDADIVWLAVTQLRRFHLIENSESVPVWAQPVSRRKLLLKYAPAALALPVIMSISAPTPAQVASCADVGGDCTSIPCCNPDFVSCVAGTCETL
jgi:hypothetical protein